MKAPIARAKAALGIYLVIGTADITMGARYFSSNYFMSCRSQAVSASWREVDLGVQTLVLALMKVAGGGWLALGFSTIFLVLAAFKTSGVELVRTQTIAENAAYRYFRWS